MRSTLSATLALGSVCILGMGAHAADAIIHLGDARVRYDDTRWQATERSGRVQFTPLGENARRLDPADLRILDDSATCTDLALQAYELGYYDTRALAPTPTVVGGVKGERFEAHTGCRNATPRGVIICVKTKGSAYLLQSLNTGCQGNNLFSGIDPLSEIANGMTFKPDAP